MMARPRRTIYAELVDSPVFNAEAADGQVSANQKWVRATEILLLAQARLAARQQEHRATETDGQAESLNTKITARGVGRPLGQDSRLTWHERHGDTTSTEV